ncbi:hypothetical protein FAGAP_11312 [Fusarium agapanthi]|uniref:HNH nuclease domain-containing protein n=1 Tax=Fusarium agapanthi TaxID=1803897 RepID=A0A9P5B175_9HYPO|nr:hypothetical protein FAGAP_11312 [Fusarium agapanthi]
MTNTTPKDERPSMGKPLTNYPSGDISVPKRTGTKRKASQSWDRKFSSFTDAELANKRTELGKELSVATKELKRFVSMDSQYWDRYIEIARLRTEQAQLESQLGLRKSSSPDDMSWYDTEAAQSLKVEHDSWAQFQSIMRKHATRMQVRLQSSRERFFRLFATSRVGLDLPGGAGRRSKTRQSNMVQSIIKCYCPEPLIAEHRWDPVLRDWVHRDLVKGAHLYPWKQGAWMDEIFGPGTREELFAPQNGLFLHTTVEDALDKGQIAIIPDIDMEPANPMMPDDDLKERQDRIKHWEQQEVKDYKVIVILKNHKAVTKAVFPPDHYGTQNLAGLNGRKLVFLTNFRPRARFVWWTYMNSLLRAAWNSDVKYQHEEVRKCTRYWGTRGRYVKRNQLLGFVEEMGHDVESILDDSSEGEPEDEDGGENGSDEPGLELVEALVQGAITSSTKCGEGKEEETTNN